MPLYSSATQLQSRVTIRTATRALTLKSRPRNGRTELVPPEEAELFEKEAHRQTLHRHPARLFKTLPGFDTNTDAADTVDDDLRRRCGDRIIVGSPELVG